MVRNKKNDYEISRTCQGYEGSPKGKKRYRLCVNFFKIKVHINYKKHNRNTEE
jgi:hypothetical protein